MEMGEAPEWTQHRIGDGVRPRAKQRSRTEMSHLADSFIRSGTPAAKAGATPKAGRMPRQRPPSPDQGWEPQPEPSRPTRAVNPAWTNRTGCPTSTRPSPFRSPAGPPPTAPPTPGPVMAPPPGLGYAMNLHLHLQGCRNYTCSNCLALGTRDVLTPGIGYADAARVAANTLAANTSLPAASSSAANGPAQRMSAANGPAQSNRSRSPRSRAAHDHAATAANGRANDPLQPDDICEGWTNTTVKAEPASDTE